MVQQRVALTREAQGSHQTLTPAQPRIGHFLLIFSAILSIWRVKGQPQPEVFLFDLVFQQVAGNLFLGHTVIYDPNIAEIAGVIHQKAIFCAADLSLAGKRCLCGLDAVQIEQHPFFLIDHVDVVPAVRNQRHGQCAGGHLPVRTFPMNFIITDPAADAPLLLKEDPRLAGPVKVHAKGKSAAACKGTAFHRVTAGKISALTFQCIVGKMIHRPALPKYSISFFASPVGSACTSGFCVLALVHTHCSA